MNVYQYFEAELLKYVNFEIYWNSEKNMLKNLKILKMCCMVTKCQKSHNGIIEWIFLTKRLLIYSIMSYRTYLIVWYFFITAWK